MQYNFELDENSKLIINTLNKHDYKAYAVGGFVRDGILGVKNSDIDIATDATPLEIKQVFKDYNLVDIGSKYGTIIVVISGDKYEVTTFRSDGNYSDGRRPDFVNFSKDLNEDLSRRDFTINSMAFAPKEGLIDPFGGERDLYNRIIRTVGDPDTRFCEDYLRLLRAVRFAAKLDMNLDKNVYLSLKEHAEKIRFIPFERINVELKKILMSDNPVKGFNLLYNSSLLKYIIADLYKTKGFNQENIHHQYDLFEHTMEVLSKSPKDLEIRLAAIFHDLGKLYTKSIGDDGQAHYYGHEKISESLAREYLKKLKFDNQTLDNVCKLVSRHMDCMNTYTEKSVKRLIRRIGVDNSRKLFYLQKADLLSTANPESLDNITNAFIILDKIINEEDVVFRKQLAINGNDIIELGFEQGRLVGKILEEITDLVMDDRLTNDKEIIKKYIVERSYKDEKNNNLRYMFGT